MWGYLPTYRNKHGAITRLQVDWKRGVNWTYTQIIGNGALTRLQINLEQAPIRRTRNKLKRHEKAINLEKTAPRRRSHKNWKKRAQQDPAHSRKKALKLRQDKKLSWMGTRQKKLSRMGTRPNKKLSRMGAQPKHTQRPENRRNWVQRKSSQPKKRR